MRTNDTFALGIDLTQQDRVRDLFATSRPQIVFHLAALVGGIWANKSAPPSSTLGAIMNTMVMHESWRSGVEKFVTCIGGCSYPTDASVPILEDSLWDGYPQAESAPYALAKRIEVVQAQAYRTQHGLNGIVLVPGNMYGPYDNFNLEQWHVIPALIRKFHEAKKTTARNVSVWDSGEPTRDFVFARDVAEALVHAAEHYGDQEIINISSGTEISIRTLAATISKLFGYKGYIEWDTSKSDGQMLKAFSTERMKQVGRFRSENAANRRAEKHYSLVPAEPRTRPPIKFRISCRTDRVGTGGRL